MLSVIESLEDIASWIKKAVFRSPIDIWTNPNPNDAMASIVVWKGDVMKYERFEIEYDVTVNETKKRKVTIELYPGADAWAFYPGNFDANFVMHMYGRVFYTDSRGICCGPGRDQGFDMSGANTYNHLLVPQRITGFKTLGWGYGVTCTLRRWRYAVSKTVLAGCGKLREVYKECIDRKAEQGLEIHHRNNWNNFLRCKPIQRIISYSRFWRSLYSNIDTCCYLIFKCWKNTFCRNLWRKVNLCTYKPDIYCNGQSTGRIYSNHISLRQINSRGCCHA